MKRREKMAFSTTDIPERIYRILDEKAKSRSLAPFIVELVAKKEEQDRIMDKLTMIEELLKTAPIQIVQKEAERATDVQEWSSGKIIYAEEVIGGIDQVDEEEVDF
ncbi:hypothetical protein [Ectobacillus sp. sgz5001026]|uniref:hypothetical protein n=1 Tax=Ectobacillus sp. sgz5001026 TaxID=3242473 RepID=UPI0036D2EA48